MKRALLVAIASAVFMHVLVNAQTPAPQATGLGCLKK
jgi:hypothetical protein